MRHVSCGSQALHRLPRNVYHILHPRVYPHYRQYPGDVQYLDSRPGECRGSRLPFVYHARLHLVHRADLPLGYREHLHLRHHAHLPLGYHADLPLGCHADLPFGHREHLPLGYRADLLRYRRGGLHWSRVRRGAYHGVPRGVWHPLRAHGEIAVREPHAPRAPRPRLRMGMCSPHGHRRWIHGRRLPDKRRWIHGTRPPRQRPPRFRKECRRTPDRGRRTRTPSGATSACASPPCAPVPPLTGASGTDPACIQLSTPQLICSPAHPRRTRGAGESP